MKPSGPGLLFVGRFFFFLNNGLSCLIYFYFIFYFFYILFLAVLGLRFCVRAFSSCGERGPLFIAVCRPLTIAASLVAEHRLQTRRLSSCGSRASCSAACGIFPDQGSNPCPLHWQAESQPLRHQGSPVGRFLITVSISVLVIGLFIFSISSWFSVRRLCFSKNVSIFSRLCILLAYS